jgi:hypothetical protein
MKRTDLEIREAPEQVSELQRWSCGVSDLLLGIPLGRPPSGILHPLPSTAGSLT